MQNGVHISCDDILAKENLSKYSAIYLPGGKGCTSFLDPVQCAKLVVYESGLVHHVRDDVVIDKNFITSKAAGTTIDFALTVIKKLISPAAAKETAKQICYKY